MLMINSHGVEMSIAGCVEEIVHDPNTMLFVFFIYFYFFIMRSLLLGTRSFVQR